MQREAERGRFPSILDTAKQLIALRVMPGDTVIDATVGNGHDTLFLARLVGREGLVYGFDIQQVALERTAARLQEAGLQDRVQLIHAGHEELKKYVPDFVQAVMFNLGYLPGADKSVTTLGHTTLRAIKQRFPA